MRTRIIAGISIALVGIISILITQLVSSQPLSDQDLKQQLEDLDSYSKETSLILDQYKSDKVTFTYVKNQTEHINKGVNQFYTLLEDKDVQESDQDKVKSIEKIVFDFSMILKSIQSSQGDKNVLEKNQNTLKQIEEEFQKEEKHYE